MSYYMRGDYYRGDYYRGDFFSAVGKIAGAVGGFLTGGPAGAVAGHIQGGRTASSLAKVAKPGQLRPPTGVSLALPGGLGVNVNPLAVLPGGKPFITGFGMSTGAEGTCPKGQRLNKSSYFLQNGTFVAAGTKCVSYRSMNPLNHRALKKGLRRAEGFERIARRTVNALRSGPKKFKSKGRKR